MYCKDCMFFQEIDCENAKGIGDCKNDHVIDVSESDEYERIEGALYVSDFESYKAFCCVDKLYGCVHFKQR